MNFDRKITKNGLTQAKKLGEYLKTQKVKLDLILTSAAKRTLETTKQIEANLTLDRDKVQKEKKLYLAPADQVENLLIVQNDAISSVAVVAHNPGISDFAFEKCLEPGINMTPGTVCALQFDCAKWSEISSRKATLLFVFSP